MKKLLLALSLFVVSSAQADSCATKLMPTFTSFQAAKLCAAIGVDSNGNVVIPVATGKKFSVTVAGIEEVALDGTTLTLGSNNIVLTSGDLISSGASKGMIAGEATRAAAVTTATTAAVPFYVSGAAASYDLTAYIGTGATSSGPAIDHFKTRATTGAASTIVQSGDTLGIEKYLGANGTTYDVGAQIVATVDATPGASADMPGALDFQLSPDGSATPASALKLTNDKKATFGGSLKLSATSAKIIPGATSLLVRDAADANTNLTVLDAGGVTGRTTLTGTTGVTVLTSGDFVANTSGSTLSIQEATGANACSGTVTANATTPVVTSTTCALTGSRIFLTKTANSTVNGSCFISALSTGVSFSITCLATDTGTYNWFIVHEAP